MKASKRVMLIVSRCSLRQSARLVLGLAMSRMPGGGAKT